MKGSDSSDKLASNSSNPDSHSSKEQDSEVERRAKLGGHVSDRFVKKRIDESDVISEGSKVKGSQVKVSKREPVDRTETPVGFMHVLSKDSIQVASR